MLMLKSAGQQPLCVARDRAAVQCLPPSPMLVSALRRSAPCSPSTRRHMSCVTACSGKSIRLAIIGDVHGHWCPDRDAAALQALEADCTLFVGDFGNERVSLVRQIACLDVPKAVILVSCCATAFYPCGIQTLFNMCAISGILQPVLFEMCAGKP